MPSNLLFVALVPAFFAIYGFFYGWRLRRRSGQRSTTGRVPLRRPGPRSGAQILYGQLLFAFWLAAAYMLEDWTWESIGSSTVVGPMSAFCAGFLCYPIFRLSLGFLLRYAKVAANVGDAGIVGLAYLIPRQRAQKGMAAVARMTYCTRVRVLKDELRSKFEHRYPGFGGKESEELELAA